MTDPLTCLAIAIYFEARGEDKLGQLLVAETVLNRVESPRYPNTVCEVVKQRHQLSFWWDDNPNIVRDLNALSNSIRNTIEAIQGERRLPNVCHYARADIDNYWTRSMTKAYLVGNHVFYEGGC